MFYSTAYISCMISLHTHIYIHTHTGLLNSKMSSHSRLVMQRAVKLTGVLRDLSDYDDIVTEPPTIASPASVRNTYCRTIIAMLCVTVLSSSDLCIC